MRATPTTEDLLTAWRDATRAAGLARRLAEVAEATSVVAERDAAAAEEVATLAEATAKAAEEAALKARVTASRMHDAAEAARGKGREDAAAAVAQATAEEVAARDRYHGAQGEARIARDGAKP